MLRRLFLVLASVTLAACIGDGGCNNDGVGPLPPSTASSPPPVSCAAAGGRCLGAAQCPDGTHLDQRFTCPAVLFSAGNCCLPGPGESFDADTTPPFAPPVKGAFCNNVTCAPGCVCHAVPIDPDDDAGACTAECLCAGASDAGNPSSDGGASVVCGSIFCGEGCSCTITDDDDKCRCPTQCR